jgi:nicotinamide-nucleotide amidase
MIEMMEGTVLPELAARAEGAIVSRILRCVGIGESRVGELLDDLYTASTNPSVAYLATTGEVKIRLTAKAASEREAERMLDPLVEQVKARLGDVVFTDSDEELPEAILRLLGDRRLTLACAESLTGGGVGLRVTEAPGSSAWFIGSAVVYTADAKRAVLGVSRETLESAGVVSEACAREMAAGARRLFGSDVGVSFTGAAGPEPHGGQPPGTIWVALDAEGRTHARGFTAAGERDRVRRWAEQAGLDLLRRHLQGLPLPVSDTTV